jgi:sn-glycerol 3-phosphate transport system substrate-binding protein
VAGYYTDTKGNMLSFPFNSSTVVFYVNKDAFKKAGSIRTRRRRPGRSSALRPRKLKASASMRLHHRLAVLDAHREFQRLAQRADRHQAERHGGTDTEFKINSPLHVRHMRCWATWRRRACSPTRAAPTRRGALLERRVRDADSSTGAQANIRRNAQVRVVGELHPVSRRREGRAAEFDHRRRLAVGAGGKKPADYKGVAKFFAYLSKPAVQMDWHTATGYVPITQQAYEVTRASATTTRTRRRHRGEGAHQQAATRELQGPALRQLRAGTRG